MQLLFSEYDTKKSSFFKVLMPYIERGEVEGALEKDENFFHMMIRHEGKGSLRINITIGKYGAFSNTWDIRSREIRSVIERFFNVHLGLLKNGRHRKKKDNELGAWES